MLAFLAALVLAQSPAAPAAPAKPVRLQTLRATSGSGAEQLLDQNPATGWRPDGDPGDEGVLFRFEDPVRIDEVQVTGCGGGGTLSVFANGNQYMSIRLEGSLAKASPLHVDNRLQGTLTKTVFLAYAGVTGAACLAEVAFLRQGRPLPVLPPREVAGRVTASSTLAPAAAYHASYLFDGRTDFGWVEGAKGNGEGEVVTIELERPVDLRGLELWNGYQRSDVHYAANARARRILVSRDGGAPVTLAVRDMQGGQKLALPPGPPASRLALTILAASPGAKYQDLVLSELRLWDAEGPVGVRTADGPALAGALLQAVAGSPLAALLDRKLVSGCEAWGDGGHLKLRRDHTLVVYDERCPPVAGASCTSTVLEGIWVPGPVRGGWAEIELFARRHRVDQADATYAETPPAASTRTEIAGGKLRVALASQLDEKALAADKAGQATYQGDACAPARPASRVLVRGPAVSGDYALDAR